MAGFSIDAALKSGFRLAGRERGAVLVWGCAYAVLSVAVQLLSIGAALPEYLRMSGQDPEAAAAVLQRSSEAHAAVTIPLIVILSLAFSAMLYGAVARAMLRPADRGFFYLRLGKRELWLLLTALTLAAMALAALAIIAFLIGAIGSALATVPGGPLLTVALVLAAVVGFAYLAMRFSLAWVQAFDEERFVLLDSWRLTRGQGWRMVLTLLALIVLLVIVSLVLLIPFGIIAGILVGVSGLVGGPAGMAVTVVVSLSALVFLVVLGGVFYTAMAAPYVEIYRFLRGVSQSETVEVFS